MTLTQQIAVLRKVAKLDKSKANVNLERNNHNLSIWVHRLVSNKPIRRKYSHLGPEKRDACIEFTDYDKIMRVLDKMIAQYKELAK